MKIAVTADVHLTSKDEHPERYNSLKNILDKVSNENIKALIIAGDLFDEGYQNYSEFDEMMNEYNNIDFHIIPGNHDSKIDNKYFVSKNVKIYSSPTIEKLDESDLLFFFIPYKKNMTMGEIIASYAEELSKEGWVLVGHGDWESGMREINPLEPGVYMPLCQKDIDMFQPAQIFLGHIHKPIDERCICYPGSPCGLNITETGKRRFVVFDTEDKSINSYLVDTDVIYFSETIIILPLKDEEKYLRNKIKKIIKDWDIESKEKSSINIRIKVKGYSSDKRKLEEIVSEEFSEFTFYNDEGVDVKDVYVSESFEQEEIARKVAEKIREINWSRDPHQPTEDDIILNALKIIYGDK